MDETRYKEWIDNSLCLLSIEALILPEVQGLGILDVELLNEISQLKIGSQSEEDLPKIARHIMLSKLWVIGVYETIRVVWKIIENKENFREDTKNKFKEAYRLFEKIRVPLAKFEKRGGSNEDLYSGIADSFIDPLKGVGWKVYEHHRKELKKEVYYRKDLGDTFLELLRLINLDIRAKS